MHKDEKPLLMLGWLGMLVATRAQVLLACAIGEVAGIGRFQYSVNAIVITMGDHLHVGFEDNLYIDAHKKTLAPNLSLVDGQARSVPAAERQSSTTKDIREPIGLPVAC